MDNVLGAALTAFFAVLVYVLGQLLQKLFIEPIQDQRRIIGEVAFAIAFYANVSGEPIDELELGEKRKAKEEIRKLASQLRSTLATIPCYFLLVRLKIVRPIDAVMEASANLIGFSNSLGDVTSYDKREAVAKALNIMWKT
jgi:hypothetical protein